MSDHQGRDIEKGSRLDQFIAKLRRLADDLDAGRQLEIQIKWRHA